MACQRCGGDVVASRQTVPYVAAGPRVVELRDVRALRCSACGHLDLQLPDLPALDTLARCLFAEVADGAPQLAFEEGRWRVIGVHRPS